MRATKILTTALLGAVLVFFSVRAFSAEEKEEDPVTKRFAELDKNKDGNVTMEEFRAAHEKAGRPEGGPGAPNLREKLRKLQERTPEERKKFVEKLSPEERRQLQEMRQRRQGGEQARPQGGQLLGRLRQMSPEERRAMWQKLPEEQRARIRERLRERFDGDQGRPFVPQSRDQGRSFAPQSRDQGRRPGEGAGPQMRGREDTFGAPRDRRWMMEGGRPGFGRGLEGRGEGYQGRGQGGPGMGQPFAPERRTQGRPDGGRIIQRLQQMSPEERREFWQSLPDERRMQIRERLREWLGDRSALRGGSGQGSQMSGREDTFGGPRGRRGMTERGRPGFGGGPGAGSSGEWYGGARPWGRWMDRPYGGRGFGGGMNQQDAPRGNAHPGRERGAVTDREVIENWDLLEDLDF